MNNQRIGKFLKEILFRDIAFLITVITFIITDSFLFDKILQRVVQVVHILDFKRKIIKQLLSRSYKLAILTNQHDFGFAGENGVQDPSARTRLQTGLQFIKNQIQEFLSVLLLFDINSFFRMVYVTHTERKRAEIVSSTIIQIAEHDL